MYIYVYNIVLVPGYILYCVDEMIMETPQGFFLINFIHCWKIFSLCTELLHTLFDTSSIHHGVTCNVICITTKALQHLPRI